MGFCEAHTDLDLNRKSLSMTFERTCNHHFILYMTFSSPNAIFFQWLCEFKDGHEKDSWTAGYDCVIDWL